jgi:hypothetical protein
VAARRRKRESRGGRLRWEPLAAAAGASGSSTTSHASPLIQRIGRTERQWKRRPRDASLRRRFPKIRIYGTAVCRYRKKRAKRAELRVRYRSREPPLARSGSATERNSPHGPLRKSRPRVAKQHLCHLPSRCNITSSGKTQGAHHLTGALRKPPLASLTIRGGKIKYSSRPVAGRADSRADL